MPQTYPHSPAERPQRRSSLTSLPAETSTGNFHMPSLISAPFDADDSIVLSDLVRTGEASRLRRRGAMRIDHTHIHDSSSGHTLPSTSRPSGASIVLVERSNWDSDEELDSPMFASHSTTDPFTNRLGRRHPRLSRRFGPYSSTQQQQQEGKDEYVYTLVCGAEAATNQGLEEIEPFRPSLLPLYPPLYPSSSSSGRRKGEKTSTGCGAVVHVSTAPRPRFRMWSGRSAASETVVPMDACYFDTKEAARFSRSPCGCVKEGIGCAVCGNPLGMRYTPCKSASDGLFCPRQSDKLPSTSAQPNLYSSSSSSRTSTKRHHIYTFFASTVTSTPSYTFPTTPIRPTRSRSFEISPDSSPRFAPAALPPDPYVYPHEEEEDSDTENFPPYVADDAYGSGWRSIVGPGLGSSFDTNLVTILDGPIVSPSSPQGTATAEPTTILDRLATSSPLPEDGEETEAWGQNIPQLPLRTRTGRTARRWSMGRYYASVSSGIGGGTQDDVQPVSFYERQLMTASEREMREVRVGGGPFGFRSHEEAPAPSSVSAPLDPDGERIDWGAGEELDWTAEPESRATWSWGWAQLPRQTIDVEAEYKPADLGFIER